MDVVTERLLDRIGAGEFSDGPLPSETEIAQSCGVSRLTVREAVKGLCSAGVLRIERGRGTFTNPVGQWRSVALVARTSSDGESSRQLLETRRVIEVGAIHLAAGRMDEGDLGRLAEHLEVMIATHADGDVAGFVAADLDFHMVVLEGTRNPYIPVLYGPIASSLREGRVETSSHAPVREHAIHHHRDILAALRTRDAQASADAMIAHLRQTATDMDTYLGPGAGTTDA